jgi:hypothetical protein
MAKILEWLKGKKSYIVAIILGIEAALQSLGINIPGWVTTLLAALGLGALRAATK